MGQLVGRKVSGSVVEKRDLHSYGSLPDRKNAIYKTSHDDITVNPKKMMMSFHTFSVLLHKTDVRRRTIVVLLFLTFMVLGSVSYLSGEAPTTTATFLGGFSLASVFVLLLTPSKNLT